MALSKSSSALNLDQTSAEREGFRARFSEFCRFLRAADARLTLGDGRAQSFPIGMHYILAQDEWAGRRGAFGFVCALFFQVGSIAGCAGPSRLTAGSA